MSTNGVNLRVTNYSTRNIFVWNNRFNSITAVYTNSSGDTVELLQGMIIARYLTGGSAGKVTQMDSTATDGSQIPVGILTQDYSIANGESVNVSICIQGDVDLGKLIFGGSPADTIATIVEDNAGEAIGTIGDLLNRMGILPITTSENTYQDNQ